MGAKPKHTPEAESRLNRRGQKRMLHRWKDSAGLCLEADPERQVVHLGIHDHGHGTTITFDSEQFRDLIRKLLGTDIRSTWPMRDAVNHGPALVAALEAALGELENYERDIESYEAPEGVAELRATIANVRSALEAAA